MLTVVLCMVTALAAGVVGAGLVNFGRDERMMKRLADAPTLPAPKALAAIIPGETYTLRNGVVVEVLLVSETDITYLLDKRERYANRSDFECVTEVVLVKPPVPEPVKKHESWLAGFQEALRSEQARLKVMTIDPAEKPGLDQDSDWWHPLERPTERGSNGKTWEERCADELDLMRSELRTAEDPKTAVQRALSEVREDLAHLTHPLARPLQHPHREL